MCERTKMQRVSAVFTGCKRRDNTPHHTLSHTHTHTHMHTHTRTHAHAHKPAHTHTHTRTCTGTQGHSHTRSLTHSPSHARAIACWLMCHGNPQATHTHTHTQHFTSASYCRFHANLFPAPLFLASTQQCHARQFGGQCRWRRRHALGMAVRRCSWRQRSARGRVLGGRSGRRAPHPGVGVALRRGPSARSAQGEKGSATWGWGVRLRQRRGGRGGGVCVCVCVPGSSHMLPSASRFRVPVCIERAWSKQCGDGGGGGLRALDA